MRASDKFWGFVWRYLTPFIAAFVIYQAGSSIGPAWRAHQGDGIRGMVTVTQRDCSGRGGCSYTGDFVSDNGKDRRQDVGLASGFSNLAVGVRVVAFDNGDPDNVFPPGGGEDWILTGLFLVGSIIALLAWIYLVAMKRTRANVTSRGSRASYTDAFDSGSRPIRPVAPGPQVGERFTVVRLREGYNIDEVEAFVSRAEMGTLSSSEARTVRFTPVRIRPGYAMGEVDDYIDSLAAQLTASGR